MVATSAVAYAASYQETLSYRQSANGSSSPNGQVSGSVAEDDSSGDAFGAAVTVNISAQGAAAQQSAQTTAQQQNADAVRNTLEAGQGELQAQQKKEAADQLVLAARELEFLKMLGSSLSGAKEATKIAQDVDAAVQQYASASGETTTSSSPYAALGNADAASAKNALGAKDGTTAGAKAAGSGAATAAAAPASAATTAGTGDATSAGGSAAGVAAAVATAAGVSSATAASPGSGTASGGAAASVASANAAANLTENGPDPFYDLANMIIDKLKQYMSQTLPQLQASSDQKTRKSAQQLGKQFTDAVGDVQRLEVNAPATSPADAEEIGDDLQAAVSATSSVNVVV